MNRQLDSERLWHAIKDAEARLKVFNNTLQAICTELDSLLELENFLKENVKFLKKKHVVALATEFKKVKDDLIRAKSKMAKVRIDRDNVNRAVKETEQYLELAKKEYANTLKGANNVLTFRRKDAKE